MNQSPSEVARKEEEISEEAEDAARKENSNTWRLAKLHQTGRYVQEAIDSATAAKEREIENLLKELGPLRELVGVDARAASAMSDIHHWTKMEDKADQAEALRAQLDAVRAVMNRGLDDDSIVGSCQCMTKTPEIQHHKPGCKYRLICERDECRRAYIALTDTTRSEHSQLQALQARVRELENYIDQIQST